MRILHIAKYYEPFKGGIEKVILELATGSVQQGHEVVVLSSNHNSEYVEEFIEGVKVIRLPRRGVLFSQPLSFGFLNHMKKWMLWADVVQVHTPNPLAELACVVNEVQTPMVVTYHCDVVRKQLMQKVYRPVAKRLLHRADKITVSTPNHLKYSEILQEFKAKSEVIPFGVRAKHAELTPAIRAEVEKLKELYGEYFLFVGRLVPYKGVDVLLKAMTRVNGNLVIVGQGPRWEGWSQLSNDLKLSDRVHFAGRVDDDNQFAAYLHGCHTLVLPSVSEAEAFGIVLIEAMSCGKPIITTELKSGVPWVNDKGVTGLEVKPKDDLALAEALTQMSQNEMMRRQMGQAARQRFENNFTVNKMVDAYCNLYSRLSGQELLQAA